MFGLPFGVVVETLVAILLATTIGYCIVLNQRLKRLHADRDQLRKMVTDLVSATTLANAAIHELKEALKYREGYVPAHVALGVVQLGLGDLGAARRSWVRAVELEPDNKAAVMYVRMLDTQQRGQ